jgi:hypothetical protein
VEGATWIEIVQQMGPTGNYCAKNIEREREREREREEIQHQKNNLLKKRHFH